ARAIAKSICPRAWHQPRGARTTQFCRPQQVSFVLRYRCVHRIPPRVRDDASAPLAGAGWRPDIYDFRFSESKIFLSNHLDSSNQIDCACEFSFCAQTTLRRLAVRRAADLSATMPDGRL